MLPAAVRDRLIDALRVDLVGPVLSDERLDQTPTRLVSYRLSRPAQR